MNNLYKNFSELSNNIELFSDDRFNVVSMPNNRSHKIGITKDRQPVIFIKCENTNSLKYPSCSLMYINVDYDVNCKLQDLDGEITNGNYTIIYLKADVIELQSYFIDVVEILLERLGDSPTTIEVKAHIDRLIDLFNKFTKPPVKTIQGVWSELLLIALSKDMNYVISSWHINSVDKYDFSDGIDKIEVKSTSSTNRIHWFSADQLIPNKNSELVIASMIVVETGIGKSIFDLVNIIKERINDFALLNKINEILAQTIGYDIENSSINFDFQLACDSLKFYHYKDIPKIQKEYIPSGVTGVKFNCDLTGVQSINLEAIDSKLFNSL